jgi:hypothetical protein
MRDAVGTRSVRVAFGSVVAECSLVARPPPEHMPGQFIQRLPGASGGLVDVRVR